MAATSSATIRGDNQDLSGIPNPFRLLDYGDAAKPRCLLELEILKVSAAIRSKVNWQEKVDNDEIVSKWIKEIKETRKNGEIHYCTDDVINYAIAQVKYLATLKDEVVQRSVVPGVYEARRVLTEELRDRFIENASKLEMVPPKMKDWHPGSNEQVLDLVHPSLFCVVHDVTRVTQGDPKPWKDWCGAGEVFKMERFFDKAKNPSSFSSMSVYDTRRSEIFWGKHQWLPAEFTVLPTGKVSIKSYVNSLHPKHHSDLYCDIAEVFEAFVPLFERVLTNLRNPPPHIIPVDAPYIQDIEEYKLLLKQQNESEVANNDVQPEDEDEDAMYEQFDRWLGSDSRPVIQPQVPPFDPSLLAPEDAVSLVGRKLQVIVKLANIELTPDKPDYPGGVWHVEGMANECIVASGIYYYCCENITESKLHFREAVCEPNYEQGDNRGVLKVFGLRDEDALCQNLGAVTIEGGLCIAFPNLYQHRVAPFSLRDKSKDGSRKILAFFLVDPSRRILSSWNVPPQQKEWMMEEMRQTDDPRLPDVAINRVLEFGGWPMSLQEAKDYRQKLMDERKYFTDETAGETFLREFSLCEH